MTQTHDLVFAGIFSSLNNMTPGIFPPLLLQVCLKKFVKIMGSLILYVGYIGTSTLSPRCVVTIVINESISSKIGRRRENIAMTQPKLHCILVAPAVAAADPCSPSP